MNIADGLSFSQQRVCLGASWNFPQHGGSSWCLPTEATPAAFTNKQTLPQYIPIVLLCFLPMYVNHTQLLHLSSTFTDPTDFSVNPWGHKFCSAGLCHIVYVTRAKIRF